MICSNSQTILNSWYCWDRRRPVRGYCGQKIMNCLGYIVHFDNTLLKWPSVDSSTLPSPSEDLKGTIYSSVLDRAHCKMLNNRMLHGELPLLPWFHIYSWWAWSSSAHCLWWIALRTEETHLETPKLYFTYGLLFCLVIEDSEGGSWIHDGEGNTSRRVKPITNLIPSNIQSVRHSNCEADIIHILLGQVAKHSIEEILTIAKSSEMGTSHGSKLSTSRRTLRWMRP